MATTLSRLPTIIARYGRAKATVYQDIAAGLFPHPVRIGPRAVAWPDDEIETLIKARIAGTTDDGIRELVAQLHAARTAPVGQDGGEVAA